jgi:ribonuclease D
VRRTTGTQLKKGERTTDWSRRPLTEAQQQYAIDDVLYLHAVYDALQEKLQEMDRADWLEEEVRFYSTEGYYVKSPDDLWHRISRHRSLSPRLLAVLRELATWRERTAEQRNVPRLRVVADDVLVDLSRRLPEKVEDLHSLRRLHPREIERGGDEIIAAVERGRSCPEEERPKLPRIREDDPELSVTVDLLATFVKYRAREISIAPSYLGNKRAIAAFASAHQHGRDRSESELGRGWRFDLVGRDVEAFLDGHLALAVVPGKGRLELLPRQGDSA